MYLDKEIANVIPANAASRGIDWISIQVLPATLQRDLEAGMVIQLELKPGTGDVRRISTKYKAEA